MQHGEAVQVCGGLQAHPGSQRHCAAGEHIHGESLSIIGEADDEGCVDCDLYCVPQDAAAAGAG